MQERTFTIFALAFFILTYLIFGALLFRYLESGNEQKNWEEYHALFEAFKSSNNISNALMQTFLVTHQKACEIGPPPGLGHEKWSFSGSLYFAGTVLTTIGYGHTAPNTFQGRLVFIIYAILSIPLNMLLLNLVLEVSVTTLSNVWIRLKARFQRKRPTPKTDSSSPLTTANVEINIRGVLILVSILFICIVSATAALFMYVEEWTYFEGVYFTVVSFTTVGLGDYVPFKTVSKYNKHTSYQLLNLVLIIMGSSFTYLLLNLLATIYKNLIHAALVCSGVDDNSNKKKRSDSLDGTIPRRKIGTTRFGSISSAGTTGVTETNPMGSFAAIQRAIDRIRNKAEVDHSTRANELRAVNTIEAILQSEYQKVRARQGDDALSRWHRAAAKARLSNRRKQSDVYKSVLFDSGAGNIIEAILDTPKVNAKRRKMSHKSTSNLSTKSLQEALAHLELATPALTTSPFKMQNFKENIKTKLSITHEEQLQEAVTYEDILKERMKERVSRRSTKSTYIPTDDDSISQESFRIQPSSKTLQYADSALVSRNRLEPSSPQQYRKSENDSHLGEGLHIRRLKNIRQNSIDNNNMNVISRNPTLVENDDTTLTYEEILRDGDVRRRRSTKSTYVGGDSQYCTSGKSSVSEFGDVRIKQQSINKSLFQHDNGSNDDNEIFINNKTQEAFFDPVSAIAVDLELYDGDAVGDGNEHGTEYDINDITLRNNFDTSRRRSKDIDYIEESSIDVDLDLYDVNDDDNDTDYNGIDDVTLRNDFETTRRRKSQDIDHIENSVISNNRIAETAGIPATSRSFHKYHRNGRMQFLEDVTKFV